MDAFGGFMASCPPAFAPDGSAIYSATGDSIIALSPTTLALLKVVPTHKRRIVQLLFLRASDSQLLILSKHRFSIYNTQTGDFSLEVSLPEDKRSKDIKGESILQYEPEFVACAQCDGSDQFVFLLEAKAAKDRTHFLILYSLSTAANNPCKAFFDLSDAVRLNPSPVTPDQLTLQRTSSQLIVSDDVVYIAIDCTLFFARFPHSKPDSPRMLPDNYSTISHDACITQLVAFNYRTSYGFLMGDLRGALYRFEGIPIGATVAQSKHVRFHWNKNGISALAVAHVTTSTPKILLGGEETIVVSLSLLDYTPQFGPAVVGPVRYISCPCPSIFSPTSLTYSQTACVVTATNTMYLIDTAAGVIMAQRHGLVSPARNLRYTPKDTPGIFLYGENDQFSILADGSPGDIQLFHGVDSIPNSALLPTSSTDIVTIVQRNKVYSRCEISDPPHILHFAALANGSLLLAVTGLKLSYNVHQEEVLYAYRATGRFDDSICLAQIFRPHSTSVKLLAPLSSVPSCDLFLTVSQLEAKVFTFTDAGIVEVFNWDICDGLGDAPIWVEAAGVSRNGHLFCAVLGDAELDKHHLELRVYEIIYSGSETSENGHPFPVGIRMLEGFDLLAAGGKSSSYRTRRTMCAVGDASVCITSPAGIFYYKFVRDSSSSTKKQDANRKRPLNISLPIVHQVCLSSHPDSSDCHYVFGIGDDKGMLFKLANGVVEERVVVFEKRHKRDRICGIDCSPDGQVYALISTRASGRQMIRALGGHAKRELCIEEQPQAFNNAWSRLGFTDTSIPGPITFAESEIPKGFHDEPSHRLTQFGTQLEAALDALF
ncbi:Hypothetical protein GLP15_2763 [Giardia lamblia P15]|uniref:Uncharacterized protein n=1 Tax=Giardia intestinalis (strain P15) TaxID=658858 RepID=E1F3F7_GIAIA|nr:Hypothetical protein GLP15_2763 [Giardia lamblia P15]